MTGKKDKKLTKQQLDKQYFKEASEWEQDKIVRLQKSEKRAWYVAGGFFIVSVLAASAVMSLAPLKSVEPFVIRVDNNTGYIDVISTMAKTSGKVEEKAQEVLDKYWLAQYIKHRESYLWDSREYDRKVVGLLSSTKVQQEYAEFTDPKLNSNAPVSVYGHTAEVIINVKSISFLNTGEVLEGEIRKTALIRYTKSIKKQGVLDRVSHWVATITYVYRSNEMQAEDRLINPLGFQVVSFRNDTETGAVK